MVPSRAPRFSLGAALLLAAALQVTAVRAMPARTGWVTDSAGALVSAQRDRLERELSEHERQRGSEVAVIIVPSLEGKSIAECEACAEYILRSRIAYFGTEPARRPSSLDAAAPASARHSSS